MKLTYLVAGCRSFERGGTKMGWLARLLVAVIIVGYDGSAGSFCKGLNSCHNIFKLKIYKGGSRSLHLPLNANWQKLVKKCDPETKTWEDEILAVSGESKPLTSKTISISLIDQNFTVYNAQKTEEGLYKIERHLNDSCLAIVNVTLLDPPLSTTITPSNITERPEAFPPGTDKTYAWIIIPVLVGIAVGVCILKWIKSRRSQQTKNTCELTLRNYEWKWTSSAISHHQSLMNRT